MKYLITSEDRSKRCETIAWYIINTGCTVREAAKEFEVSKSTVHKDVTEKLRHYDRTLADRVRMILDKNKAERHIRGGNATKRKFHR